MWHIRGFCWRPQSSKTYTFPNFHFFLVALFLESLFLTGCDLDLKGNLDALLLVDSDWLLGNFPWNFRGDLIFIRGDIDFAPFGDFDLLFLADLDFFAVFFLEDLVFERDLPLLFFFGMAPVDWVAGFWSNCWGSILTKASYPTKPHTFPESVESSINKNVETNLGSIFNIKCL